MPSLIRVALHLNEALKKSDRKSRESSKDRGVSVGQASPTRLEKKVRYYSRKERATSDRLRKKSGTKTVPI